MVAIDAALVPSLEGVAAKRPQAHASSVASAVAPGAFKSSRHPYADAHESRDRMERKDEPPSKAARPGLAARRALEQQLAGVDAAAAA